METQKDVYRELQEHLDNMPVGYPATESGVEIRILKHLFTPEEAEIALNLSALPETLGKIHRRVKKNQDIPIEELDDYDPLISAIAITGGTETVFVRRVPRFRIGDETYGPFNEERVELPISIAVFLLCKNAARLEP